MEAFNPAVRSWDDYLRVYKYSLENYDLFWDAVARKYVHWRKEWTQVSECNFHSAQVSWYPGAELNVAENCLDRHVRAGLGDKKAIIWVGNDPHEERSFTFSQLLSEVNRAANALEAIGIRKGDRVVLYLPNIPELAISVLACARIGAIHSVIFGGFSATSIHNRVVDSGAKLIITAKGTHRGSRWIDLKSNVDEALAMGCPSVERVIVLKNGASSPKQFEAKLNPCDLSWDQWIHDGISDQHLAPSHSALDPLFILYTSGSTGTPKGVVHRMGGYLTYVTYSYQQVFQTQKEDIYWCTADMGWITGHSYLLYGPLSNGITTVMFEGVPIHPDPGRFWEVVDRLGVTIFYTAPTAIRILASSGNQFVKKYQRKSLRVLGTVGEPINPEAWKWYHEVVGEKRSPIVDTWWQTETGGIMISALAGISPTEPGCATFPLPGVEPKILDENGKELTGVGSGSLVIARSWPGQMAGVYGDPDRFYKTYFTQFPGYYSTGDGAHRDQQGKYWILGRTDDVIKVSGHRLGTAEIESACITHSSIAESAAVGVPDATTGEALHVFAVLRAGFIGNGELSSDLIRVVRKEVGPLATPKKIHWVPGLPKTRSGKIMRRILKKIAVGEFENLGDVSTLAEPAIVNKIIECERALS